MKILITGGAGFIGSLVFQNQAMHDVAYTTIWVSEQAFINVADDDFTFFP
jgi:nucleoside-diphosphate-sugar epimerase